VGFSYHSYGAIPRKQIGLELVSSIRSVPIPKEMHRQRRTHTDTHVIHVRNGHIIDLHILNIVVQIYKFTNLV
jgi:hypothetical protein